MSILIKGMNLPEDGCHHMVCIYGNGVVVTNGGQWIAEELPPHGRCIDADLYAKTHADGDMLKFAPTVIPADPAEKGEI